MHGPLNGRVRRVRVQPVQLTRIKGIVERAELLVLFPGLALWLPELFY